MDWNIQTIASILTATGIVVVAVIKFVDWLRAPSKQAKELDALHDKHDADMKAVQTELTVIVYGLRGALQGLIEQGCNGPCKEALQMLDKHLNKSAHEQ